MNRDELDRGKEGGHGAYKGDDGLSDAERIAYAVCNAVSLFVSSLSFGSVLAPLIDGCPMYTQFAPLIALIHNRKVGTLR